jgi:hypothetical protein
MADHVDFEALAAWWLGELPAGEAQKVEEHFFACAHCAARLEWLAALPEGVRAALRAGALGMVVSAPFVEAMKRAGLRLREYRLDPGGRVDCTIAADDDAVVSRVRAPLAGVKRLDILEDIDEGRQRLELRDVPFDAVSGEVLFIVPPAALKRMPAHVARMRLVAVDEAGRRTLGDYTFNHTPSG